MSKISKTSISAVKLKWQDQVPLSTRHKDYYFSLKNGLKETRYVYLAQNQLPQRWLYTEDYKSVIKQPFTIIETGFGTGLNFLTAWQSWQQLRAAKRPLNFISIEKYPLSKADLIKSLENWPELGSFSQELIEQYPYLMKGSHLLSFNEGKVKLLLIFGDVNTDLEKHTFTADCWFLDGFSPSKNPSMWTDTLFNLMAKRANEQTTFSSFSAAGVVRKGLAGAGFEVIKNPGFGGKRDMISGYFKGDTTQANQPKGTPNWSLSGKNDILDTCLQNDIDDTCYDAIVIGAGLSGCTTAASLAEKGLNVALIDQRAKPVSGASGQSQLALYVKLPTEINMVSDFISHCIHFSQRYLALKQNKHADTKFWAQTGLLQLAWNDKELKRHDKFSQNCDYPTEFVKKVNAYEASALSGLNTQCEGLWFQNSGWLNPITFAQSLIEHNSIHFIPNTRINKIRRCDRSKVWEAQPDTKDSQPSAAFHAKHLIIANSNDAKRFTQTKHLPTKPLRGQVSSLYAPSLTATKSVICGEGYLCPAIDNWHHFGATFDLNRDDERSYNSDNDKNIASLQKWLPDWLPTKLDSDELTRTGKFSANAGLRCTTPDYMPIIGRAPDYETMLSRFSALRRDATSCSELYGSYHQNLYVNIGYGSKGLVTTPIGAELISSLITGSPCPFSAIQKTVIEPARFIIKRLKQGKI